MPSRVRVYEGNGEVLILPDDRTDASLYIEEVGLLVSDFEMTVLELPIRIDADTRLFVEPLV